MQQGGYGRDLFVGTLDEALDKYLPGHMAPRDAEIMQGSAGAHGEPYRAGNGPPKFSTDTRLAPSPLICWDCNGWYAAIGAHWRMTRKELRTTFINLGPLPSAWQMHCLKQLLNPVVRREYDRLPLGGIYLDDVYAQEALHRLAAMRASEARKRGENTDMRDMLDRMGFRFLDGEEDGENQSPETVDEPDEKDDDDPAEPARLAATPWRWGYYLWKSRNIDVSLVQTWQALIVQAFAERGEITQLAVGLHGAGPNPWLIAEVGYLTVIFLNDGTKPKIEAARAAVEQYIKDRTNAGTRKAIAS